MSKRLTNDEFIQKAKNKHYDKNYDYSLVNYINWKTKVIIIDELGFKHEIIPNNLLNGNKLSLKSVLEKDKFITHKFINIHSMKYDYSLVKYVNEKTNITIICPIHGVFGQTIDNHLKGKGCPKCNGKNKTTEDIIIDFERTHGLTYDYSKVEYNGIKNKVNIICNKHGVFNQSPEEHIKGCGCPICKESSGERKIRLFLLSNNIKFIPQHKFINCKHILELPFDFYLPELNICIEYQGEQHYKPIKIFGGETKFKLTLKRDGIKENFCFINNIKLLIIPYDKEVNNILNHEIIFTKNNLSNFGDTSNLCFM